jgi:hypothetical protein
MGLQQFGPIGGEVASYARELVDYLAPDSGSSGGPSEWLRPDVRALESWLEIEDGLPLLDVFDDVDGEDRKRLHDTLLAFHTALPYNEAERGWLGQIYRLPEPENPAKVIDTPQRIEGHEDRIMVAGVRRAVSGRDLMRRWITWRRATGEFEGQDSVTQARSALVNLNDLLD